MLVNLDKIGGGKTHFQGFFQIIDNGNGFLQTPFFVSRKRDKGFVVCYQSLFEKGKNRLPAFGFVPQIVPFPRHVNIRQENQIVFVFSSGFVQNRVTKIVIHLRKHLGHHQIRVAEKVFIGSRKTLVFQLGLAISNRQHIVDITNLGRLVPFFLKIISRKFGSPNRVKMLGELLGQSGFPCRFGTKKGDFNYL